MNALKEVLLFLIRGYRLLISPLLPDSCRFQPTCSAYAIEAIQRHGAIAGAALALRRILRCHPWCEGGYDPVPGHTCSHNPAAIPPHSPQHPEP